MVRLTASSDILANAKEIRAIGKRPTMRVGARTNYTICAETMAPGEKAYVLTQGVVAHAKCVYALRERLDEATPRRQAPRPGEFFFEGEGLEVK
jgi:hypothetical protein